MIGKKILMIAACLLLLTGCSTTPIKKVLIDEPALLVTAEGRRLTICDRQTRQAYVFHTALRKRTEGDVEPHRAIDTNTIQVTPLPHGGLEIVTLTDGKVYKITHRWGVF